MNDKQLYVLPVEFKVQCRRLFLEGPAGEEGRELLKQALEGLKAKQAEADNFPHYYQLASDHFKEYGFKRVAH